MRDFATSTNPAVQAQLTRLAALSLPQGRFGLDPIRALLAALGDPQNHLPPTFHVAGTNGKGSTCAFLRAMLESAGHKVHVFTSPHLVRFNERIRVAGQLISDAALAAILSEVLDAAESHHISVSFFEVSTAAAFLIFARTPADACVIEVGLGGRFDATNVLPAPVACGIASLGIDHEAFLLSPDDTAPNTSPHARIAFEKAGIAKNGTPLLTRTFTPSMNAAIAGQAAAVGAILRRYPHDWNAVQRGKFLSYRDSQDRLKLPLPRLNGHHQQQNAALAVAILRHQSAINVPISAMAAGIEWAKWPARLQLLGNGPLTKLLPPCTPCWLDGGHNPDAGRVLADHFRKDDQPIHLIIGMLANKNPNSLVLALQNHLTSITVVPVPGHDSHPPSAFAHIPKIPPIRSAESVTEALHALIIAPTQEQVLIAGSLYLAGEVLRLNAELPD